MSEDSRTTVVEGLAAVAVTLASMGASESQARAELAKWLLAVNAIDVSLLRDAAAAVTQLPQPPDESAETIARREPIRAMLGVPSAAEELEAQLKAREWLQRMAEVIEADQG